MYEIALLILNQIVELGYEAYIVGGYPRDLYLHIESYDIDICTSMPPEQIINHFSVIENHQAYGSFVIEKGDFYYEITTFRKDIYCDSRYPKIEFVSTLNEDLQRRDFIVNTLCIDQNGNFIDLLGARKDIKNKQIRVVGDPNKKMREDPLRMIRAIRFACHLKFNLDPLLLQTIYENRVLLKQLSSLKVNAEIEKIVDKNNWNEWVVLLDLKRYLP